MNLQQIVFPVDFSDACRAAAKYVKSMARKFGSGITLVHAVADPLSWHGTPHPVEVVEVEIPRLKKESESSLQRFAAVEFADLPVGLVSEMGDIAGVIEETVKKIDADLVMLPTRGQGRFRSALLGSVTTKLLHDLSTPVWTGIHREEAMPDRHVQIRNVLCALDLEPESAPLLRFAADFAKHWGATLFLAHGVPATEMLLGRYSEIEPPIYMEDFARGQIEKLQREAGTSAEVWLESAPIAEVVRKAALQREADIVMVGRGLIAHAGRFREHTHAILRESPCPVLSV